MSKIKIKVTEDEAVLLKGILSRHSFEAAWYRRHEADLCSRLYKRLSIKLAKL